MRTLVIAVLTALTASFSMAKAHEGTVYVAGKARYCKETPVSGYLGCFYASLDACEKQNKAAILRCGRGILAARYGVPATFVVCD